MLGDEASVAGFLSGDDLGDDHRHAGAYGLTPESARKVIAEAFTGDWALWKKWKASVDGLGDAGGAVRVADLVEREMAVKS